MKMEIIFLLDNEKNYPIDVDMLHDISYMVLKDKRINFPFNTAEISLVITDDEEMKEINKLYRKIDSTTDVLSFPINEDKKIISNILGDIVISFEKAKAQSVENECSIDEEIAFLFIHGLLHLLGYDHEKSEEAEKEMFEIQENIFETFFKNR
jgi:probable rRNA maturation factor